MRSKMLLLLAFSCLVPVACAAERTVQVERPPSLDHAFWAAWDVEGDRYGDLGGGPSGEEAPTFQLSAGEVILLNLGDRPLTPGLASELEATGVHGLRMLGGEGLRHLPLAEGLTHLRLASANGLTDEDVAHIAAVEDLSHLSLESCDWLTDAHLETLTELESLDHLDVRGCPEVTEAGIEAFRNAVPGCRVLTGP